MARQWTARTELAQRIEAAYPDAREHQLFQYLIGGSADQATDPTDFPVDYSIEAFMRKFISEHTD